jgi:hypothetical protein
MIYHESNLGISAFVATETMLENFPACSYCGNYTQPGSSSRFPLIFGALACVNCGDNFERERDAALSTVAAKWKSKAARIEKEEGK